jgi:hypothetical protein
MGRINYYFCPSAISSSPNGEAIIMSISKQILLLSCVLLLLPGTLNLFIPAQAQAGDESNDAYGDAGGQVAEEEMEGEQHVENPVKEVAGERTLEQEYNEHGVDWHEWAENVAGAVWTPLIQNRAVACGSARVRWQVTSDCRVHIISVYSPIPNGAQVLVTSIKSLDRNPVLAFPPGSKKTVVWRDARVGGRPIMHRIHGPIRVYP